MRMCECVFLKDIWGKLAALSSALTVKALLLPPSFLRPTCAAMYGEDEGQRLKGKKEVTGGKGVGGWMVCVCVTWRNILQTQREQDIGTSEQSATAGGRADRQTPLSARERTRRALTYLEVLLCGYISD